MGIGVQADIFSDIFNSLARSFSDAIHLIIGFIPPLIGAIVLLIIGWIIATIISAIVARILHATRLDDALNRAGAGEFVRRAGLRRPPSGLLARVVFYFVFLIFVVAAANALNIPAITQVVNSIILWLPNLFVALLVLIVGVILARFVGDLVHAAVAGTGIAGANFLGMITRVAIIAFAAIIALNQIGVGSAIVQTLFTAVVGGLALGLAIAFGLGGQTTARQIVDSWYRSLGQPTNQTTPPALPNGSTRASTQSTNALPSSGQTQPPANPER